jgi:diguanylate cyclase (GGDEF)-like protein/PAS domain S-box-containing protein
MDQLFTLFDSRTLGFFVIIQGFLFVALLSLLEKYKSYQTSREFYLGNSCAASGFLLLEMQSVITPFFTIFIANLLIMAAVSFMSIASFRQFHLPLKRSIKLLTAIFTGFTLFFFYYTFISFSTPARIIILSLALLGVTAWSSFSFVTFNGQKNITYRMNAGIFLLFNIISLSRIILTIISLKEIDGLFSHISTIPVFFFTVIAFMAWNMVYIFQMVDSSEAKLTRTIDILKTTHKDLYTISAIADYRHPDMEEFFKEVCIIIQNNLQIASIIVYLIKNKSELEMIYSTNVPRELCNRISHVDINRSVAGESLKLGRPLTVDVTEYPDPRLKEIFYSYPFQRISVFPLAIENHPLGSITIATNKEQHIEAHEFDVMEILSKHISTLLYTSRLINQIADSEEQYRTIFNTATDAVIITDLESTILDINNEGLIRYGYTKDQLLGKPYKDICPEFDSTKIQSVMAPLIQKGDTSFESVQKGASGKVIPSWIKSVIITYRGSKAILSIARDITEKKIYEEKLVKLAATDSLTGILNRREFMRRFESEFHFAKRYNETSYVCVFDLDNFKKINDTYGHSTGDSILLHFTRLVKSSIRKTDLFGRYGGEEFTLVIMRTSRDNAMKQMNKLYSLIHDFNERGEALPEFTVSSGISGIWDEDKNAHEAVNRADKALYEAKKSGKDRFVFYEDTVENR